MAAIEEWLIEEFTKRFQQKASEYLTTLLWFDPNRYWLQSIPWLLEKSTRWAFSSEEENQLPMKLIGVGPDIPDGKGRSPLSIRLSILSDRISNSDPNGFKEWKKVSRWIIYYPYSADWLNEATRPKKSLPVSWLMPFCEGGLEWGRRGGDEEKLPAFLRAHGVDITKDKKQLSELYHLTKSDRSACPLSRLVVQNLDKPKEFWRGKSWDLNTVQNELLGDLGRQMEELLVTPEITMTRLQENGVISDFLAQMENHLGGTWNPEELTVNPGEFCRKLVRHVALSTTWKLTDYDEAFPFRQELPPEYKIDHCQAAISDWIKIPEVGEAYIKNCRSLEKEGLNLTGHVDERKYGHVFPHLILSQWLLVKSLLEAAINTSVKNIRSVLRENEVEEYDKTWDQLMPGELGWRWLVALKEMEQRLADGESWLSGAPADNLDAYFAKFSDFENGWWKIDDIFRKLLVLAVDDPEGDLIKALAFPIYNTWIEVVGKRFTETLVKDPELSSIKRIHKVRQVAQNLWSIPHGDKRKAVILTDALRYDLATEIHDQLKRAGFGVQLESWLGDLPSKTEVGMSRLLPDCELKMAFKNNKIHLTHNGKDFKQKNNRIAYIKEKLGEDLRTIELKELSKARLKDINATVLVVFTRDIDAEGEAKGLGLAKDIDKEISELVQKVRVLAQSGYQKIHIVTDHGFLLSSAEGLVKWKVPQGAEVCERRFAIVPKSIGTDLPAISSPWDDNYWIVLPPARTVFKAGGQTEYMHGGASLQEVVLPYIRVEVLERVVRVVLTMLVDKEVVDSGIVKIILRGESPVDQLPLGFMPTALLPRSGKLIVERKGEPVATPKSFELGVGDDLKLTLFLERGLKEGDEIDIVAKDGKELLATKTLKVIRDV